jgi:myosin heavy subunit
LLVGASIKELEALGLAVNGKKLEMDSFEYLKKSKCFEVKNIKDLDLYHEVKASFSTMNFSPNEEKAVWSIVSVVLNLGNLEFDESTLDNGNIFL